MIRMGSAGRFGISQFEFDRFESDKDTAIWSTLEISNAVIGAVIPTLTDCQFDPVPDTGKTMAL